MKFFTVFFFLVFFSTAVLAGGGPNGIPTLLLPEKVTEVPETPIIIQVIVQDGCRSSVTYYNTPGITAGGMVASGSSSVSTAGVGFLTASALSGSVSGNGGVFGTTGQVFPVVTSCLRNGGENE